MANSESTTYDTSDISYAAEDNKKYLEALREAVKNNDITLAQIQRMADDKGVSADALVKYATMSRLDMEKDPYYKSDLSDKETVVPGLLGLTEGETYEVAGCKITCLSEGNGVGDYKGRKYKCESDYLGTFEYNPYEFEIGYKEIEEDDGTTSQLPVLQFCGSGVLGGHRGADVKFLWWDIGVYGDTTINIPDGVKSIDYTFANNATLEKVPDMPNSVTSAHYAFSGCTNMDIESGEIGKVLLLPHDLQDMSGMFKNCSSMSGIFSTRGSSTFSGDARGNSIPESVVNITEAWNGCEAMDDVQYPNFFGGFTYSMPGYGGVQTPYLCADLAKDALAGISDNNSQRYEQDHGQSVKDYADSRDYVVESGGKINEDYADVAATLDQDQLDATQAVSAQIEQGRIHLGAVFTDTELASNNARSDNKIYNASKNTYTNDLTGEMLSDNVVNDAWWERAIIDGSVGLGIFGIASHLTGNKLIGAAIGAASTFALDHFNVLPKSLYPVLTFTANLLPDCGIKDKLKEWAEALPGSKAREYNNTVAEYNAQWIDPYNVAVAHKDSRLSEAFKVADSVLYQDIGLSMTNNGRDAAMSMSFMATAMDKTDPVKCVSDTVKPSVDAMTSKWAEDIAADGLTDATKVGMREYYSSMMKALESYNNGAVQGITGTFIAGSVQSDLSYEGLGMVNREYTKSVMDSLVEMNKRYQFMDDKTWNEIQALSIDGIDVSNLKNYKSGYFAQLDSASETNRKSLAERFESEKAEKETSSESTKTEDTVSTASSDNTDKDASSSSSSSSRMDKINGLMSGITDDPSCGPEMSV